MIDMIENESKEHDIIIVIVGQALIIMLITVKQICLYIFILKHGYSKHS